MTGHYHWIVLFFAMKKSLAGEQDSFSKRKFVIKMGKIIVRRGNSYYVDSIIKKYDIKSAKM